MPMIDLTDASLELFLAYARDAANWDGRPPIGENVDSSRESQGHITQMKKAGLITTERQGPWSLIVFTDAGRALAAEHGVEVSHG